MSQFNPADLVSRFGVLGVVVAAAIALVTGVSPTAGPAAKPSAKAAKAAEAGKGKPAPEGNGAKEAPVTHLDFLRRVVSTPGSLPAVGAPPLSAIDWDKTDLVVVCVPDPVGTQFGFWFDQAVESVNRAMLIGDDLTLDRHWYPPAAETGPTRGNGWETEPGVILYRATKDPSRRRVALLVGESPVSGPNAAALEAALDVAAAGPSGRRVRVLGPFFSGSQRPLAAILGRRTALTFRVVSGSELGLVPDVEPQAGATRIAFESTQVPMEEAVRLAVRYLRDPNVSLHRDDLGLPSRTKDERHDVALLIESNSGYGAGAGKAEGLLLGKDGVAQNRHLVLRFPMHVSELIRLTNRAQRARDEQLGLARPGGGGFGTLDDEQPGGDALPSQDAGRTALINQRVLDDYWFALKREGVRYAGVIATDPRDKIFLIEQMRRACPNVQPFVIGTEAMYAHPEYLPTMRGVVIAGGYPLNPTVTQWTRSDEFAPRLPFPSGLAQGVFNAALVLCDPATPSDEPYTSKSPPRLDGLLLDYGPVRHSRACYALSVASSATRRSISPANATQCQPASTSAVRS